jgi:FtsP/CotA-like multicopper oxidase with cupredoxin domain
MCRLLTIVHEFQIRIKEGGKVQITLKNELSESVFIHWHGIPTPNETEGIPEVTKNTNQPGESFTYTFTASVPQDSTNQIDKGIYRSFIVEPKEKNYARDYTLMLGEWISNPEDSGSSMSSIH